MMDCASLTVDDDDDEGDAQNQKSKGEGVVGFENQMNAILGYLGEQTKELDVITIFGMPGSGKTTLARMAFFDERIQHEFPIRIWIHVSSMFREKYILLTILRNFITISEDVKGKSDEELAYLVTSHLKTGKFLIVLDDMWATHDWDRLRIALPKFNNMGKVLITSCNEDLGRYTSKFRQPHKVQGLSETESWELLQLEVFDKNKCPRELEFLGKHIAKYCYGLPLAVVTVADKILTEHLRVGIDIKLRKDGWLKTGAKITEYCNEKFYDILPTHLKVCFLYLAVFPYDSEIPAGGLIRMWIAEGFIASQIGNGASLEECGEAYLQDLIRRNLVKIGRKKADGKVKTCRIDHSLHKFCKTEAGKGKKSFLTEIKFDYGVIVPKLSEPRRLSIHSNIPSFISSKPSCPHTRSFFVFSEDQECLFVELISPEAFKLLRVLDAKQIIFLHIDSDMYHLLHLRYFALSSRTSVLPAHFSKLWNIQTLLVNTTSRTLDVKPDTLEFTQLRHFKTNASANLCKVGKAGKGCEKIQSLGTISPESCTKELFNRARNLKKLGIRGKLSLLLEGKIVSFDSLAELGCLEYLKLISDVYPNLPSVGRLESLPPHNKFPPTLKSLTLAGTYLDWSQMSILALLEKLEVLKLKNKAFMGRIWETEDGGFRTLQALHIDETDLVIWLSSACHFPALRTLKLRNCGQLREVPIELARIPCLTLVDLYETHLAASCANRFVEEKERFLKIEDVFKLSVYPPFL